jgi:hypothetical protein
LQVCLDFDLINPCLYAELEVAEDSSTAGRHQLTKQSNHNKTKREGIAIPNIVRDYVTCCKLQAEATTLKKLVHMLSFPQQFAYAVQNVADKLFRVDGNTSQF